MSKRNNVGRKIVATISHAPLCVLLLLAGASASFAQQAAPVAPPNRDINARASSRVVDSSIPDDPAVDQMLTVYSPKVRALDTVIGTLKGELRKGGMGAGSLGNFITDAMRAQAALKLKRPVDLAIVNGSGLRRSVVPEGELRARDIFELLPFENALVLVDMNGEQLMSLLGLVTSTRDAQSGARVTYKTNAENKSEIESARLFDEQYHDLPIDPRTTYTVVTIDYLLNRGGTTWAILREGKNVRPLGVTLRDAVMDYVKAETAAGRPIRSTLDGRFVFDKSTPGSQPPSGK